MIPEDRKRNRRLAEFMMADIYMTEDELDKICNAYVDLDDYVTELEQDISILKNQVYHLKRGYEIVTDTFYCEKCRGEVGHRINCPDGIAFSDRKYTPENSEEELAF